MPFDPVTHIFTRVANTFSNPVSGVTISPTDADALMDDYDDALTEVFAISNLDDLLGSTPDLFAVRGATEWGQRAIVGSDLPNPSTTTLGGVFSLPVSANEVLSGIGNDGTPTRATTTGTGNVVRATSPTISTSLAVSGTQAITSNSSGAFAVGRLGLTTPAFVVDASAATSITGLAIMSQAAGNGVNINGVGETNVPLIINAAGSGTINFNTSGTGSVNSFRNFTIAHDSTPTLTIGLVGGTLGTITTPGTTGLQFVTNSISSQVKITHTASADRQVTLTGSNGGNPTISTTAGDLALTGNLVASGSVSGTIAAGTVNCPLMVAGVAVNFNSVGDNAITIVLPAGVTRYRIQGIITINNGTTASLTTAQFGVFTSAAGAGTAIVASGTALTTITSNAAETNTSLLVSGSAVTAWFTDTSLFYRVTQAQGAAASGFAYVQYQPLPG